MALPEKEVPPFTISSVHEFAEPPVPPWIIKVRLPLGDGDPGKMDGEARRRVKAHLDAVVEKWKANDAEYARCQRLTEALVSVEKRLAKASEDTEALNRVLRATLFDGLDTSDIDAKLIDLRAETLFLQGRKAELTGLAADAKDAAEASLRKVTKEEAGKLRTQLLQELDAARGRLFEAAYEPLRHAFTVQTAADVADPRTVVDFLAPDALAGLKPDGLAFDRRQQAGLRKG